MIEFDLGAEICSDDDRQLRRNRQATVGGAVRGVDFVHATAESVDEEWSKQHRQAGRCAQADQIGLDLVA